MIRSVLGAPLVSLLAVVFAPGQLAAAAPMAAPHTQPFSLTVSPPRIIIASAPGHTVDRTIEVTNSGSGPVHVDALLSEFSQQPDGSIHFESPSSASGVSEVVVRPTQLEIPAQTTAPISVSVTMLASEDQGERQIGVILRVPPPPGASGNIIVTGAIGVEILIGPTAALIERTHLDALHASGFSAGGSIPLTLTVAEAGNIHREFDAPGQLFAAVGGTRVYFPDFIILKGVTRTVKTTWRHPPFMCICTAKVTTTDGQGHSTVATTRIVIFPLPEAGGALVLLVAAAFLLRRRAKGRRSQREKALEAARRQAYEQAKRDLGYDAIDTEPSGANPPR